MPPYNPDETGFLRAKDASNSLRLEYEKEYEKSGTIHSAYKLENVTDLSTAIDYVRDNVSPGDRASIGAFITIGYRDEFGNMQYRNTNTISAYETGTLFAHAEALASSYGFELDDIEEFLITFEGEM